MAIAIMGLPSSDNMISDLRVNVGVLVHDTELLIDHPLLSDRQNIVGQPIQNQAGREEKEHHAECQWHVGNVCDYAGADEKK